MLVDGGKIAKKKSRSPSWGAWIEINNHVANVCVSALLTFMRGAEKWRILYNYVVHSST